MTTLATLSKSEQARAKACADVIAMVQPEDLERVARQASDPKVRRSIYRAIHAAGRSGR